MKSLTSKFIFPLVISVLIAGCSKDTDDQAPLKENPKNDSKSDEPVKNGNWFVQDPEINGFEGTGSERAINELQLENKKQIVVAVIDSGVDIKHEDLQGKIWVNAGETGLDSNGHDKAANKLDDDNNGYIDDIHGWNYLGAVDGRNVTIDTLEITREAARYDKLLADGITLSEAEIKYFEDLKKDFDNQYKSTESQLAVLEPIMTAAIKYTTLLTEKLNLTDFTKASLLAITSTNTEVITAKTELLEITANYRSVPRFFRIYDNTQSTLKYYLNKNYNSRDLVGDDPADFVSTNYGNSDVTGPDSSHGTHVAGIIAAVRGNGIGIDGVAENVKIMVLRVVPNGDERDKDIALAVRYAADNGAHIINMSFGKSHSPHKNHVDSAFLHAAEKNVLLFHSAGNGASNNDTDVGFPNRTVQDALVRNTVKVIPTWLEIGASAKTKDISMVANFSDYGKKDVDLFSPGFELNSTTPNNTYAVYSGTSMASPAAAGVAALLLSNYPDMTAFAAKNIILAHVRLYGALDVKLPGAKTDDPLVPFSDLSATGGVIDALKTMKFTKSLML